MATAHISEADAASDFPALMDRIRAGDEVTIESNATPFAVLKPAAKLHIWADRDPLARARMQEPEHLSSIVFPDHPLRLSESIALAERRAAERGVEPAMEDDFAANLEDIVRNRKLADRSAWD